MTRQNLTVAVVGATGVVGRTMIQVLLEREFPVGELKLLASERSAGRTVSIEGRTHEVELATGEAFEGVDDPRPCLGCEEARLREVGQRRERGAAAADVLGRRWPVP